MGDNGTSGGVDVNRDGFATDGFNAGMRGKKCWACEGGHRNACFVRWPGGGIDGGRDVLPITAHIDMLPTLIGLGGLKGHDGVAFDGVNIAPLLRGDGGNWPRRTLFVHNQQIDEPEKHKDFAAMTDRWRLVRTQQWGPGRQELFDIQSDPGQRNDLSSTHPEVVMQLLEMYDRWWEDISQRFGECCPIVIGHPTKLTAHSWHGEEGLYGQLHVRSGSRDNGWWAVEIERDGLYEFALRRWPEEVDKPIRAPLPGRSSVPFVDDFVPGEAIEVVSARLKIAGLDETKPVHEEDCAAIFRLDLGVGSTRLQTWFTDETGESRGAYYVYV